MTSFWESFPKQLSQSEQLPWEPNRLKPRVARLLGGGGFPHDWVMLPCSSVMFLNDLESVSQSDMRSYRLVWLPFSYVTSVNAEQRWSSSRLATEAGSTRLLGLGERATADNKEKGEAVVKPKRNSKAKARNMRRLVVFILSDEEELASSAAGLILTVEYVGDCMLGGLRLCCTPVACQ